MNKDIKWIQTEVTRHFARRKFAAGVALAFTSMLLELKAIGGKFRNQAAFLKAFPPQLVSGTGKSLNTLIVSGPAGNVSLRKHYDSWEHRIRVEERRYDYPNCAPHATQSWKDYLYLLDRVLGLTIAEVRQLQEALLEDVLAALPSHAYDGPPRQVRRPFHDVLTKFPLGAVKGEPAGAAFQGAAFAWVSADAPHLQIDMHKVGAGSKRLHRVGDIDGWSGEHLALTAEVKHREITADLAPALGEFVSTARIRGALPLVVAEGFDDEAKEALRGQGAVPLDLADLARLVEAWDPMKQEAAVLALEYYITHIEKNSNLIRRWREFRAAEAKLKASPQP